MRVSLAAAAVLLATPAVSAAPPEDPWRPYAWTSLKPGTRDFRARLGGFLPLWQSPRDLLFLDARAVLGETGYHEGNLGVGYRRLFGERWIVGGALFYDRLRSSHHNTFHQVTVSLEALSRDWDLRLNGYLPLTSKRALGLRQDDTGAPPYLSGNHVLVPSPFVRAYERALHGFELELGRRLPLPQSWPETRAFLAGYHFDASRSRGATGGRVRLESRVSDRLSLGLAFQHDDLRESQAFLEVQLRFGPGARTGRTEAPRAGAAPVSSGPPLVTRRMTERVRREVEMVVDDRLRGERLPPRRVGVLTPEGPEPLTIWFVDNTAAPGGDGSFERPFDTLVEAESAASPGQIIFVFTGDGTTAGQDGGIALQDHQRLFGQGVGLSLAGAPLVPAGTHPQLTNTGGPVVSLASGNEVAGIHSLGGEGGILGESIRDFWIHDNIVESAGAMEPGIGVMNASGFGRIEANRVLDGSGGGIVAFSNADVDLSLVYASNIVTDNADFGLAALTEGPGTIDVVATSNTVTGNADVGIGFGSLGPGTVTGVATSNTVSGNDLGMAALVEGSGRVDATFRDNDVDGNTSQGILGVARQTGSVELQALDNRMDGNGEEGVLAVAQDSARITATIDGNTLANSSNAAIRAAGIGAVTVDATITDNDVQTSSAEGITVSGGNFGPGAAAVIDATISDNRLSNVADSGILATTCGPGSPCTSQATLRIERNTVDGAGREGVTAAALGGGSVDAMVSGNTVRNAETGLSVGALGDTTQDASFDGTVSGNVVENATDQGVRLLASGRADTQLLLQDNEIDTTGDSAIFLIVDSMGVGGATPVADIDVDGNTIRNAGVFGLEARAITDATLAIDVTDNSVDGAAGGHGLEVVAQGNGVVTSATFSGNQVSGAQFRGINVGVANSGQVQAAAVDGNTATGNQLEGIGVTAGDAGTAQVRVSGNDLSGNDLSGSSAGGFLAQTFGTSAVCLELSNNTNTQDYGLLNPTAGPTLNVEDLLGTNTGTVNQTGTITIVPAGTCAP